MKKKCFALPKTFDFAIRSLYNFEMILPWRLQTTGGFLPETPNLKQIKLIL
jgi:hypothetical protein